MEVSGGRTAPLLGEGLQYLGQAVHLAGLLAHTLHLGISLCNDAGRLLIHPCQLALVPSLPLGLSCLGLLRTRMA